MNSENKSLLVISVGPKIALSRPQASLAGFLSTDEPARRPTEGPACAAFLRQTARLFGATEIEGGFPHSEISGSKPVRGSPKLIAAYHVLHRLSAPRHPPDTLMALDCSHRQSAFFPVPDSASATNMLWREKTSFASNASGDLKRSSLDLRLVLEGSDFMEQDLRGLDLTASPTSSRPIRPSTECASSSQCQRSKGLGRKGQKTFHNPLPKVRPTAHRRSDRSQRNETDKFHRNQSGVSPAGFSRSPPLRQKDWWSQTGSNRRPHACKARALPTELWPRMSEWRRRAAIGSPFAVSPRPTSPTWWAWEDLNLRPHAYQARALTN